MNFDVGIFRDNLSKSSQTPIAQSARKAELLWKHSSVEKIQVCSNYDPHGRKGPKWGV